MAELFRLPNSISEFLCLSYMLCAATWKGRKHRSCMTGEPTCSVVSGKWCEIVQDEATF